MCRCLNRKGRKTLFRGEEEGGRATVNKESMAFHWLSSCQGRKEISSSCWTLLLSQGERALLLVSQLLLRFLFIVYIFPFSSRSFSENTADQESGFLVFAAFCPSMPGKTFPGYNVPCQKESAHIGNLLRLHSSNKEGKEGELSGTFCIKSICYQYHRHWRSSEALCHYQMFSDKLPTGLVQISLEGCFIRCHLLQF